MKLYKSPVVMMLLFSLCTAMADDQNIITPHTTSQNTAISESQAHEKQEQNPRAAYRDTMDRVADVFSDILYPIKKCWHSIVDTLSPHHPVIKDIKNAADHIGGKIPVIAQEITTNMQQKAHEINDYIMQEAEETAQRVSNQTAQVITDSAHRALDYTQEIIENSVHNATQDAIVQMKQAHQEMLVHTDASVQQTTRNAMVIVNDSLTDAGRNMGKQIAEELKLAAGQISQDVSEHIEASTRKNSVIIAKIALVASVGLSGLGAAFMGTHRFAQNNAHAQQDLGMTAAGLLITAICYKALDHVS